MIDVYIGVGSNIAPEANLPKALTALQRDITVSAVATVYRTAPIGRPEQADYLNTVWQIRTEWSPRKLNFSILRPLEAALGRIRTHDSYAARPIDLDILVYGDFVVNDKDLVIPDPDIRTRPFLAIPLLELAPELILPDTQKPLQQVVAAFGETALTPEPQITQQLKGILNHE